MFEASRPSQRSECWKSETRCRNRVVTSRGTLPPTAHASRLARIILPFAIALPSRVFGLSHVLFGLLDLLDGGCVSGVLRRDGRAHTRGSTSWAAVVFSSRATQAIISAKSALTRIIVVPPVSSSRFGRPPLLLFLAMEDSGTVGVAPHTVQNRLTDSR